MRLPTLRPVPKSPPPEPSPPGPGDTSPWRRLLRVPSIRDLREALRRNPELKLVSLLLAFFLWFSINVSERNAERVVDLQVTVRKVPADLIVTSLPGDPVKVTVRGPRTILDGIDERKSRLAVDLAGVSPGDVRVEVSADMVRPEIPRRLTVVQIEPARVRLRLERLVRRLVPVRADLAGMPALGYSVTESHVTPGRVEASGPASKVDDLKEITTEPVDLRGLSETTQRDVPLAWAGGFVTFAPDHVRVTATLEEVIVSREFKGVEVRPAPDDDIRAQITPARVDVTVRGPQRLLHNFKLPDGAVTFDASGLTPGQHRVPVRVELPAPLEVTARQPEVLTVLVGPRGTR